MVTKSRFRLRGKVRDSYLELINDFPLVSIQSERHLAEAQQVLDRLVTKGKIDPGEVMYLEALSDLVAAYEDEHHAIEPASDAEMLLHLLQSKSVSQMELCLATGLAKSTISEVLAGKRPFSRKMIRKLADFFHVDVGVLAANF